MVQKNPFNKKRVLLINRFPYWLYCDKKFFLEEVEDICILHSKESKFDFPPNQYSSVVICDFSCEKEVNDAVEYLFNNHQFNVVINLSEPFMELAADIREKYKISGMDKQTAKIFRDKIEMKKAVAKTDVIVPKYTNITCKEDIYNFHNDVGKSILKPISGMGAYNTFIIEEFNDISRIIAEIDDLKKYEMEQFIAGEMFHCDSIIVNGNVELCSISRYSHPPINYSKVDYLSSVMIDDKEIRDKIETVNKKVINALNYKNGVTHLEVFLSEDEIIFCEIAARAGGSGIIPSIKNVYEINLFEADIKRQLNCAVDILDSKNIYAGWLVIFSQEGIVSDISSIEDFNFDWIYYKEIKAKRGDILRNANKSTASVAEFTVWGDSEADVLRKINMLREEFRLNLY
ncbi:acetyl-CoA carboxylase biotin carboxylase subunit family protein [Priestia aryabhattai]|uniref:ATP-grasp domain-containing protein n=1 Tax=Priestia TaxID=2800373 RepID=UPI00398319B6